MTILGGQLLMCDRPGEARIAPGYVVIEGETIAKVVEGEIRDDLDMGGDDTLITPGFIDAHVHLSQFAMIGAHGMPLLDWLSKVTFPTEIKWNERPAEASREALHQLLSVGTTGICAYATSDGGATLAALREARELGLRGVIGHVMMDRPPGNGLCRSVEELRADTIRTLTEFPPGSRMAAAVTPRFAVACTETMLAEAGKLAAKYHAVVQTHLAETQRECETVAELFPGKSYVQVYRDAGLLGPRSILGHGIYLNEEDRCLLSELDCVVAHCPTANSFLQSGTMNRQALIDDGVRIALGSDVGAGYERSMVRVARAMIDAAASLGGEVPTAAQAWYQITAGNAETLGWSDAGRIQQGFPADLLLIQPKIAWLEGTVNPLARLMWSWDDRWLTDTFVRGRLAYI